MGDFDNITLATGDLEYLYNTISSDAMAIIIIDRIKNGVPTSWIRTADGERMIIVGSDYYGYLQNPRWLARYGLVGKDVGELRKEVLWAGNNATFLSCSPSGLCVKHRCYKTNDLFIKRDKYADHFYQYGWKNANRVIDVLKSSNGVTILHRDGERLAPIFAAKYGIKVDYFPLNSWQDHIKAMEFVKNSPYRLVLVSGGASGKALIVKLAQETGKVVLDVGEAMTAWADG